VRIATAFVLFVCATSLPAAQVAQTANPLVPVPAISAIIQALRTHDVVGLSAGEGHGDARGREFVVSLIRDPQFSTVAVDVVAENGNARFQDVMDRYISGESVDIASLRPAWNDTTQVQVVSAAGQVPEVFRTIRDVNLRLPRERQIRVLLPDPPIDWDRIQTNADYRKWLEQRDANGADVVRRETRPKGRHALLIYGSGHLQRRNQLTNYRMDDPIAQTVVSLLERAGAKTFIIGTAGGPLQSEMRTWPVPGLTFLRGTSLGLAPQPSAGQRVSIRDGRFIPIPREEWISVPLQEEVDALLYLGPTSERRSEAMPPEICSEPGYVESRIKRMIIAGLPQMEVDRLKQFCEKVLLGR
jgi:hypothetical protein